MTKYFLLILTVFISFQVSAQNSYSLRKEIIQIISTKNATVSISIKSIEDIDVTIHLKI